MAGKSASLLTKTQRKRIQDDFETLDEEKKHRDQQRIRKRVKSGIFDFQLLADYPDRQLALMFDDVPEDELRAALADTTIVLERLREQSGIDREKLIEEVRAHIERDSDPTEDTRTLEQIDLRTAAEIRRQTEDELTQKFGPGLWDKRANGLMKLGVSTFILMVLGISLHVSINNTLIQSILVILIAGSAFLLVVSAMSWICINTIQSLKYNILPFVVDFANNPKGAMRGVITKLFKNPRRTVRESWEEL